MTDHDLEKINRERERKGLPLLTRAQAEAALAWRANNSELSFDPSHFLTMYMGTYAFEAPAHSHPVENDYSGAGGSSGGAGASSSYSQPDPAPSYSDPTPSFSMPTFDTGSSGGGGGSPDGS